MRKLGILVMAMVLVLGMSFGAMAVVEGDPADDEVSDSVDVTLNIDKYAAIEFGDDFTIDLDQPRQDGQDEGQWEDEDVSNIGSVDFDVQTNTDVVIDISETFTQSLIDAVGEGSVWPDSGDWIANSYMWVLSNSNKEGRDFSSGDGNYTQEFDDSNNTWDISFEQDATTTENYELFVESKWNSEEDWYELEDGAYTGTITATVSAP